MIAANPTSARPMVSVIVPARNEEASLAACLSSIMSQSGVSFEVIVVDDASTDRTAQIARSFPGVRVLEAGPLPEGWMGKNNAMVAGAKYARGQWLLFTDADTVHLPGSLGRSLAEAQQHKAALLSYSPEQEVHGFWENAVMPVIFAELAATFPPSAVSNPASRAAAANGQYLLISRQAYDAVGGHAAVATNLLEDVALARAVKRSGRKIFFRYGADAVRARMYRSFAQLSEGWTKNLALLFPSPARLAILRLTEFVVVTASAALAVRLGFMHRTAMSVAALILGAILYGLFLKRIRRAHFHWDANLLAVAGLPLFSYLVMRSLLARKRGIVNWKGRTYASSTKVQAGDNNARVGSAA